jgi:transketolase
MPYGGTFLVFTDYARPAIRLSALMGVRVVYVMTHDSIGLGEDGPTHQPVEHLAALRCIPNLLVFRPADAVETAESWELALAARSAPSVIALTRQGVPALRRDATENRTARGAYVLAEADGPRAVTLLATGSEVGLAMEARALLAQDGIGAAVVSMPCWELFEGQDAAYRAVLGAGPRVRSGGGRRLGPLAGRPGCLRRHAGLRRLGPGGRALSPFRHHRPGRRRRRARPAVDGMELKADPERLLIGPAPRAGHPTLDPTVRRS